MNWQREGGRPPIPRKKPLKDMEKEPLVSDHPFVDTVFSKYLKPYASYSVSSVYILLLNLGLFSFIPIK